MAYVGFLLLIAALWSGGPAAAQQRAEFGGWRLACVMDRMTDAGVCLMRHRDWVEPPSGATPGLALELVLQGGALVPAIIARDFDLDGSRRGLLALAGKAQLRFPPNPLFEMPCGLEAFAMVCVPKPEDAARAGREFQVADRALARFVSATGETRSGPPATIVLADTRGAVAWLRAEAPLGGAVGIGPSALGSRDINRKLGRAFGTRALEN